METDKAEEAGKQGTVGSVKIEWNQDFDNRWHELKSIGTGDKKYSFGQEGRFQAERAMQALLGRAYRQGCHRRRTNGRSVPRLWHSARRRQCEGRVPKDVRAGRVELPLKWL